MIEIDQAVEISTAEGARVATEAFRALGLGTATLHAITDLGYSVPTSIQEQTIPLLLARRDVIGQAPTGTGKTAAYGLPLIERLNERELRPQGLVVVPTRELAMQVAEALHELGKYREVVTLPIYGGAPYDRQLRALKRGVQIVIGTPGRLLDHLGRGTLNLDGVQTVVLDEADEMLNMGFIEDIEAILARLPSERQTALFSATIPARIATLAEQYLRQPIQVSVAAREAIAPRVRQVYYEVSGHAKTDALARLLDMEEPDSAIIFVRTRRDADHLAEHLNSIGYLAQAIHGDINQGQRERTLERFRAGHTQVLVATDVAARGLDIPDVSHIINYDLPLDAESYVHRIGRTGRAGATGEALTLVTPRERRQLRLIERAIHRRLEQLPLPSAADVTGRRLVAVREEVLRVLNAGQLDPFLTLVEDLAGTYDPAEIAAAAFKMVTQTREANRPGYRSSSLTLGETAITETQQEPPARVDERRAPEYPPRKSRQKHPMTQLFLRIGKRDGAKPGDIVGAIANEANLPGEIIGEIAIHETFSSVEIPEPLVEMVRLALNRTTIRGQAPHVSLASPQGRWQDHEDQQRQEIRAGARSRSTRQGHLPIRLREEAPPERQAKRQPKREHQRRKR
ncbi:MAG TPA: DEAD/DEAH box helicase [Ktedonobacterales bacterium]|nr:DEAD/DEAH box helicase [Ktedonobacterales bacterium]